MDQNISAFADSQSFSNLEILEEDDINHEDDWLANNCFCCEECNQCCFYSNKTGCKNKKSRNTCTPIKLPSHIEKPPQNSNYILPESKMHQHYIHCYYEWFRLSCIHLSMPFMGYAINLALADCKRKDQSAARIILTFPLRVIILPWVILKDIWQGELKVQNLWSFLWGFPSIFISNVHSLWPWTGAWHLVKHLHNSQSLNVLHLSYHWK